MPCPPGIEQGHSTHLLRGTSWGRGAVLPGCGAPAPGQCPAWNTSHWLRGCRRRGHSIVAGHHGIGREPRNHDQTAWRGRGRQGHSTSKSPDLCSSGLPSGRKGARQPTCIPVRQRALRISQQHGRAPRAQCHRTEVWWGAEARRAGQVQLFVATCEAGPRLPAAGPLNAATPTLHTATTLLQAAPPPPCVHTHTTAAGSCRISRRSLARCQGGSRATCWPASLFYPAWPLSSPPFASACQAGRRGRVSEMRRPRMPSSPAMTTQHAGSVDARDTWHLHRQLVPPAGGPVGPTWCPAATWCPALHRAAACLTKLHQLPAYHRPHPQTPPTCPPVGQREDKPLLWGLLTLG